MKLRQGEIKKTMKGILAGAFLLAAGSAAVFAVGTETELKAYAAEWQQAENGDWTYKENDGSLVSGWQKIGGICLLTPVLQHFPLHLLLHLNQRNNEAS